MSKCSNPGDCSNRSIRKLKWLQSYLTSAEEKLENFQEKLIENEATLTYARHANDRKVDRLYSHQEVRGAFKNGWVIDYTSYRDEEEVIIIMAYIHVGSKLYRPIHMVCAVIEEDHWMNITVIDPAERPWQWTDNYQKRICFCKYENEY